MKWIYTILVLALIWGWGEFCLDCEPMREVESCEIHPVYNCFEGSMSERWERLNEIGGRN